MRLTSSMCIGTVLNCFRLPASLFYKLPERTKIRNKMSLFYHDDVLECQMLVFIKLAQS